MSLTQDELAVRIETVRTALTARVEEESPDAALAVIPILDLLLSTIETIHEINGKLQKATP